MIGFLGLEKNGNVLMLEIVFVINKIIDDGSFLDERVGFWFVWKVVVVGLEWFDWLIRFIIGYGLEGGNRDDRLSEV